MLLFEHGGLYSWDPEYSISLTRQTSTYNEERDDFEMTQLKMSCKFSAGGALSGGGNQWFDNVNGDIDEFLRFVLKPDVVKTAGSQQMLRIAWCLSGA